MSHPSSRLLFETAQPQKSIALEAVVWEPDARQGDKDPFPFPVCTPEPPSSTRTHTYAHTHVRAHTHTPRMQMITAEPSLVKLDRK